MKVCALYSRGPHYVRMLKALRQRFPEAEITALVPPAFPDAPLAGLVDHIDRTSACAYSLRDPEPLARFLLALRSRRYDVMVTMFDSTRLRLLAKASGAKERYCLTLDGRMLPLTQPIVLQALRAVARNAAGRIRYWRIRKALVERVRRMD